MYIVEYEYKYQLKITSIWYFFCSRYYFIKQWLEKASYDYYIIMLYFITQ